MDPDMHVMLFQDVQVAGGLRQCLQMCKAAATVRKIAQYVLSQINIGALLKIPSWLQTQDLSHQQSANAAAYIAGSLCVTQPVQRCTCASCSSTGLQLCKSLQSLVAEMGLITWHVC